jgi:hypothetical protein
VCHNYGTLVVTNSTISGNFAQGGGGIFKNVGFARITNSTISGNSAQNGGGVFNSNFDLYLNRTLISGNTAPSGSEVYNYSGIYFTAHIEAANFNLFGHSGLTNAQAFRNFTRGVTDISATSNGNRPTALGAILNTTLANNGGPTQTHALVAGSPAIDSVNNGTCPPPTRDQRGVTRPRDGNGDGGVACDTGAFEL